MKRLAEVAGGWTLRAALLILPCLLVLSGCGGEAASPRVLSEGGWKVAVGEKMPDFELPSVDGKKVSLEEFRGKPVVLSFFATWCGPCRQELPQLESRVWQAMKDKGVQVVAVSTEESASVVNDFLNQVPLTFPVLLDEEGDFFQKVADSGIPRLVVLDRDHVIRHLELGFYPPHFGEVVKKIGMLADRQTPAPMAAGDKEVSED